MDAVIILTGSRAWTDRLALETALFDVWHDALQVGYDRIVLWHGDCPEGADALGDRWARANRIEVHGLAADWDFCGPGCPPTPHRRQKRPGDRVHPGRLDTYCPMAGPRRNNRLVIGRNAALCVAAPLGKSVGTRGCMKIAVAAGIPIRLVEPGPGQHMASTPGSLKTPSPR